MRRTVVSCPGKVLFAGGYLVLDRAHYGYVVATASRFYTVVSSPSSTEDDAVLRITARSPQFDDAAWSYECAVTKDGANCHVKQIDGKPRNPFLQIALEEVLRIVFASKQQLPGGSLDIAVLGDNDFYSQDRHAASGQPRPFAHLHTTLDKVHKTGLGSSAAMVTSLVGGLLAHFGIDIDRQRALLHNLAQYAHSLAQGKIGSGFDVSAAVYGSQRYRRFDPANLPDLTTSPDLKASNLLHALLPDSSQVWTASGTSGSVSPFRLPPHTALLLADVDIGSNTPSMVSKVLAWRKAHPAEAETLWGDIARHNDRLDALFGQLDEACDADSSAYNAALHRLAPLKADEWTQLQNADRVTSLFLDVRQTILDVRRGMRQLGEASGVPIEPPEQTQLLDTMQSSCAGVLGGGVPGAGGYDAVWLLCVAASLDALDKVELALAGYTAAAVRPLSKAARVLGRREVAADGAAAAGPQGVQLEDFERVPGLAEAVGQRESRGQ